MIVARVPVQDEVAVGSHGVQAGEHRAHLPAGSRQVTVQLVEQRRDLLRCHVPPRRIRMADFASTVGCELQPLTRAVRKSVEVALVRTPEEHRKGTKGVSVSRFNMHSEDAEHFERQVRFRRHARGPRASRKDDPVRGKNSPGALHLMAAPSEHRLPVVEFSAMQGGLIQMGRDALFGPEDTGVPFEEAFPVRVGLEGWKPACQIARSQQIVFQAVLARARQCPGHDIRIAAAHP